MFDARSLHGWLGTRWGFAHWIEGRITECGFEEGVDFRRISAKTGGRPRKDVLVTLDMAKELAMVERTERGRQTRRCASKPQESLPRQLGRTLGVGYRGIIYRST